MIPRRIELHPLAVTGARAARRWYARRSANAALRFMDALDRSIEQVATAPDLCPGYLHGTRACRLRRFPSVVVFRETEVVTQIVAVAHLKRRPGYWRRRDP